MEGTPLLAKPGSDYEIMEGPRSIVALLSPAVSAQIKKIIEERPELFNRDEHDLLKLLRDMKASPNATDNRLRLSFWNEYERAQTEQLDGMRVSNIHNGICTHQYFLERYLQQPERVAWLLCPPTNYEKALDEALCFGVEQLREILALPLYDAKGKLNTALASLKERIVSRLDERKNGSIVQRSLSVAVGDGKLDDELKQRLLSSSMEEIQKRLKALAKRDRLQATPDVVEVEAKEIVSEQ